MVPGLEINFIRMIRLDIDLIITHTLESDTYPELLIYDLITSSLQGVMPQDPFPES